MEPVSRHQCLIYEGAPSQKLPTLAITLHQKLKEGYRCLYMNSPAMVAGMRSCLAAMDVEVAFEIARASLVLSSEPVSTTWEFQIDEMLGKLENALDQALLEGYKGLWATGDMTWEFGDERNFVKLVEYEWKLEGLFRRRQELFGICQYRRQTLPHEAIRDGVAMHHGIFINETLSRVNPHYVHSVLAPARMANNTDLDQMIAAICGQREENS